MCLYGDRIKVNNIIHNNLENRFYSSNLFHRNEIPCILKQFSFKAFKGTGFFYKRNSEYYFITNKHIIYPIENVGENYPKFSKNMIKNHHNIIIYNKEKDYDNSISLKFLDSFQNNNVRMRRHYNDCLDLILIKINELFNKNPKTKDEALLSKMKAYCNYFIFSGENILYNESICNENVCIIGFPYYDRDKYPTLFEAKIICDTKFDINKDEMYYLNRTIPNMFSGSPVILSKSIKKFMITKNFNDIKLVGVEFGNFFHRKEKDLTKQVKEGLVIKSHFIEEIFKFRK